MKQLTKQRPIIFTGDSVKKILAGRKTMTRRIVKPQPVGPCECGPGGEWWDAGTGDTLGNKYQPGMRLCVRERWRVHKNYDNLPPAKVYQAMNGDVWGCIGYQSDGRNEGFWGKWRSPLFMSVWASRLTLEITDVLVQRVQDISRDDCVAEGCTSRGIGYYEFGDEWGTDARECFRYVWRAINGDGSWESNPWVWAISFKRVQG